MNGTNPYYDVAQGRPQQTFQRQPSQSYSHYQADRDDQANSMVSGNNNNNMQSGPPSLRQSTQQPPIIQQQQQQYPQQIPQQQQLQMQQQQQMQVQHQQQQQQQQTHQQMNRPQPPNLYQHHPQQINQHQMIQQTGDPSQIPNKMQQWQQAPQQQQNSIPQMQNHVPYQGQNQQFGGQNQQYGGVQTLRQQGSHQVYPQGNYITKISNPAGSKPMNPNVVNPSGDQGRPVLNSNVVKEQFHLKDNSSENLQQVYEGIKVRVGQEKAHPLNQPNPQYYPQQNQANSQQPPPNLMPSNPNMHQIPQNPQGYPPRGISQMSRQNSQGVNAPPAVPPTGHSYPPQMQIQQQLPPQGQPAFYPPQNKVPQQYPPQQSQQQYPANFPNQNKPQQQQQQHPQYNPTINPGVMKPPMNPQQFQRQQSQQANQQAIQVQQQAATPQQIQMNLQRQQSMQQSQQLMQQSQQSMQQSQMQQQQQQQIQVRQQIKYERERQMSMQSQQMMPQQIPQQQLPVLPIQSSNILQPIENIQYDDDDFELEDNFPYLGKKQIQKIKDQIEKSKNMPTESKKEKILEKIRELYQEEIEFVDGDKKDVDAASKSNKKIKCPYIKCQKECKENQMNKHIKEAHPELSKAGFELDGAGNYKYSEQLLDYVLLVSEIYPLQYQEFLKQMRVSVSKKKKGEKIQPVEKEKVEKKKVSKKLIKIEEKEKIKQSQTLIDQSNQSMMSNSS